MEAKSLDVDFINEEQLRRLLQPPQEQLPEPVEAIAPELKKGQEIESLPKTETVIEEPPPLEPEVEETKKSDLETDIPEDDLFVPPTQATTDSDSIAEIESIKSAIPIERIRKEELNKQFSAIVKNRKIDLSNRSRTVKKKALDIEQERTSASYVNKARTIVSENRELLQEKRLTAKWKQVPLNRTMRRDYQEKLDKVIKENWNLPFEMDPSLEARVKLIIAKSGKLLEYEIVESSQNRFFNHTIVQLFKNLDHLPPLPEDFSGESTEIGLRFTSQQFNSE